MLQLVFERRILQCTDDAPAPFLGQNMIIQQVSFAVIVHRFRHLIDDGHIFDALLLGAIDQLRSFLGR